MNRDFAEMLSALLGAGAEFLVIGAHAVAVHARPRATGDMDVWVRPSPDNAGRVWSALEEFGAPLHQLELQDLTSDDLVFQIGLSPNRIDILTDIGSLRFEDAWPRRVTVQVEGIEVPVIGKEDLIIAKREAGRPQDLADVAQLGRDTDDPES
jgi:predicted nucleotidyltransferase